MKTSTIFQYLLTTLIITTFPIYAQNNSSFEKKLITLEASADAKVGIYALDTSNHQIIKHRADDRFPVQSTFKMLLVSAFLKKDMTDKNLFQQKITFKKDSLVFWSPITEKHLADGMSIADLCAASAMYSDNTATNILMQKLGGPQAVTAFAHSIGNNTFELQNWEPELNSNPHSKQDTSTPAAMAKSLQHLALGNVLAKPQREQLITWMKGNTTGDTRIRAGVPKGWIVADKTGAGDTYGISNDIAIIWPPYHSPIIIAIYTVHNKKDAPRDDKLIVSATHLVVEEFSKTN